MDVQVGVFSATLPPEALEITRKFMNKPVRELLPLACHAILSRARHAHMSASCAVFQGYWQWSQSMGHMPLF